MKKVLSSLAIAVLLLATSCSKEAKLNRKIDGDWNVTTVDGTAVASNEKMTFSFNKDKKDNGKVVLTDVQDGVSISANGTYTLTDDKIINMVITFLGENETWMYTVEDYSKKSMKLKDEDGMVYELSKK